MPKLKAYDPKKKCSLCQVLIINEVHLQSHLRGRIHGEKVAQISEGRNLTRFESCLSFARFFLLYSSILNLLN